MGVGATYKGYAVEAGATLIGAITRQAVRTGTEVAGEATSGEVYRRFLAIIGQRPGAAFETKAIATALGAAGATGASIADMAGGLSLHAYKTLAGGSREATLKHRKYNATEGLLLPRTLNAPHGQDVTLDYDALFSYDGSNDPVTITDLVTVPAGVTDAERFSIGPSTLESITIASKLSLQITFGIKEALEAADGDIWPTHASIEEIEPELRISGYDIEYLKAANIPLAGKAVTHANSTIYFRKRLHGSDYVADATEEHIKITVDGLAYVDDAFDSSGLENANCTLVVPLRYDGTNLPIAVTLNSAIP